MAFISVIGFCSAVFCLRNAVLWMWAIGRSVRCWLPVPMGAMAHGLLKRSEMYWRI